MLCARAERSVHIDGQADNNAARNILLLDYFANTSRGPLHTANAYLTDARCQKARNVADGEPRALVAEIYSYNFTFGLK